MSSRACSLSLCHRRAAGACAHVRVRAPRERCMSCLACRMLQNLASVLAPVGIPLDRVIAKWSRATRACTVPAAAVALAAPAPALPANLVCSARAGSVALYSVGVLVLTVMAQVGVPRLTAELAFQGEVRAARLHAAWRPPHVLYGSSRRVALRADCAASRRSVARHAQGRLEDRQRKAASGASGKAHEGVRAAWCACRQTGSKSTGRTRTDTDRLLLRWAPWCAAPPICGMIGLGCASQLSQQFHEPGHIEMANWIKDKLPLDAVSSNPRCTATTPRAPHRTARPTLRVAIESRYCTYQARLRRRTSAAPYVTCRCWRARCRRWPNISC